MEKNELSKNAKGGTELMLERVHNLVDKDLLDKFQIIPTRVRELDPNKKKILYIHDLPNDPEVRHLANGGWEKFDHIVYVSYWQQDMFAMAYGIPYAHSTVIRNAIEPIQYDKFITDDLGKFPIRLIYTSTPHRGLNILVPVFEELAEEFGDKIHLDVFSSFKLYGWEQRDQPYQHLFDRLEKHPQATYHGTQSNDTIREYLAKSHIFAYPSTWVETSCLCLIEAMSAGCHCVHSSLGALSETSMNHTRMYQFTEDPDEHAERFYDKLKKTIEMTMNFEQNGISMCHQKDNSTPIMINQIHNLGMFSNSWNDLLERLDYSE